VLVNIHILFSLLFNLFGLDSVFVSFFVRRGVTVVDGTAGLVKVLVSWLLLNESNLLGLVGPQVVVFLIVQAAEALFAFRFEHLKCLVLLLVLLIFVFERTAYPELFAHGRTTIFEHVKDTDLCLIDKQELTRYRHRRC